MTVVHHISEIAPKSDFLHDSLVQKIKKYERRTLPNSKNKKRIVGCDSDMLTWQLNSLLVKKKVYTRMKKLNEIFYKCSAICILDESNYYYTSCNNFLQTFKIKRNF